MLTFFFKRVLRCSLLGLLFLGGCAVLQKPEEVLPQGVPPRLPEWKARVSEISSITAWQASGSMAARQAHQAWSGNVAWQQSGSDYTIDFSGPAAAGHFQVRGTASSITLTDTNGASETASTPEELLQRRLGWDFPSAILFTGCVEYLTLKKSPVSIISMECSPTRCFKPVG